MSSLPERERQSFLAGLSETEAARLLHSWEFWARDSQVPPEGRWRTWLVLAGRGFGKTRTGAELVNTWAERLGPGGRIAIVGPTAFDTRHTMIEGESGILACSPPWFRPRYLPTRQRIVWPNGVVGTTYSAEEPARLRGPQHHKAWGDELAVWRRPEAWDNLQFGLRLGNDPQSVVTTTPKRVRLIRELLASPNTVTTRGTTYENAANLAPAFLAEIVQRYEGTRTGRQELHAELLDDDPRALWQREAMIEAHRVKEAPELVRVAVAVDPSGGTETECGIVAAGLGVDGHGYVLDDRSRAGTPQEWAGAAVALYRERKADRLVAEANYGGQMVEATIRTVDPTVAYRAVQATRGKAIRAEPVAALYEQGKVHHVGMFPQLEDEQCGWVAEDGGPSPNRLDALVWVLTELMLTRRELVFY